MSLRVKMKRTQYHTRLSYLTNMWITIYCWSGVLSVLLSGYWRGGNVQASDKHLEYCSYCLVTTITDDSLLQVRNISRVSARGKVFSVRSLSDWVGWRFFHAQLQFTENTYSGRWVVRIPPMVHEHSISELLSVIFQLSNFVSSSSNQG